jgi:alpha-galactosidase
MTTSIDTGAVRILPGNGTSFLRIANPDGEVTIGAPCFEIDAAERSDFRFLRLGGPVALPHGGSEWRLEYSTGGTPAGQEKRPSQWDGRPVLLLGVQLRTYPGSPIFRLRYTLSSQQNAVLTKSHGSDNLRYLSLPLPPGCDKLSEVRLSEYEPVLHAYLPSWETRMLEDISAGESLPGPILALHGERQSVLAAYEHGADHPQSFLRFVYRPGEVELRARMGNYHNGHSLGPERFWTSPWLELGLLPAGELGAVWRRYRRFALEELNPQPASRQPLICYNTWNYQERNHLYNQRPYLESMNLERMLAEIDIAHAMGIDVFVIDTGWFIKTGDWQVSPLRFPDGLTQVKARLDAYGMRLGLWFNPLAAALTSQIYSEHPEYQMSWRGKLGTPWPVWETEESVMMCLASDYTDYYIEVMKRFRRELGVTYFKWDGIGQYGCDSGLHQHGTEANAYEERADCYAFRMGLKMIEMIEAVTAEYPDVIVDFDATECGRFVGLGFLSAGRFFMINNGSYAKDFDTPESLGIHPWMNMFFYPGAARPRVCRRGSSYDFILPSSLFLIHYLPDGPANNRENSLASLVLGGNGIWGDLPALSPEDVDFWHEGLADYKRVLPGATRSATTTRGFIGSSPEIHEKIDAASGIGLLVFFTVNAAETVHITQPLVQPPARVKGADDWELLPDGRVRVRVKLERDGARTVFFLPQE